MNRLGLRSRGMTLVELMVSMGILVVVVAMTMNVVMAGVRISRRGEEVSNGNEAAMFAGQTLVKAAQSAGWGAPGGVLVVNGGGAVERRNSIVVVNSAVGPDELWVVRPHKNVHASACSDPPPNGTGCAAGGTTCGAAQTVQRSGFGNVWVRCASSLNGVDLSGPGAGTILMASNMTTGVLLTGVGFTPIAGGVDITYAESATATYATNQVAGFQKGDMVYPVLIERYFIAPDPTHANLPGLFRAVGTIGPGPGYAMLAGPAPILVQPGIEDLQIAVATDAANTGDPTQFTWANGVGGLYVPGMKSLRISVSALSLRPVGAVGNQSVEYNPLSLEDHVVAPAADGFRRTLFSQRVELPNLAPVDL
ncbi:MAG: PilW family protein [Myxococcaceae bacterium]